MAQTPYQIANLQEEIRTHVENGNYVLALYGLKKIFNNPDLEKKVEYLALVSNIAEQEKGILSLISQITPPNIKPNALSKKDQEKEALREEQAQYARHQDVKWEELRKAEESRKEEEESKKRKAEEEREAQKRAEQLRQIEEEQKALAAQSKMLVKRVAQIGLGVTIIIFLGWGGILLYNQIQNQKWLNTIQTSESLIKGSLEDQKNDLKSIQQELDDKKQRLATKDEELNNFTEKVILLQNEKNTLQNGSEGQGSQIAHLNSELEAYSLRINRLKVEKEELQKDRETLENRYIEAMKSITALQGRILELNALHEKDEKKIAELRDSIGKIGTSQYYMLYDLIEGYLCEDPSTNSRCSTTARKFSQAGAIHLKVRENSTKYPFDKSLIKSIRIKFDGGSSNEGFRIAPNDDGVAYWQQQKEIILVVDNILKLRSKLKRTGHSIEIFIAFHKGNETKYTIAL